MKRITIKDIARETGYSKSTVSRALGEGKDLRKSTRNMILQAAKKLNYYPNEMARSLVASRASNFIGVIVSDVNNQWYTGLIKAFEDTIKKTNYNIILCNTNYDKQEEARYIELLIRNRAVGAIITGPEKDDPNLEILSNGNIPFVVIGTELSNLDADIVSVDNYKGARMAMRYLIEKGHRNIVHFTGPDNFRVTDERIKAYKDVLAENGIEVREENIIRTGMGTKQSSYIAAKNLDYLKDMPTAIFAYCDYIALGVWKYLSEKGLRVPDDISLIGFDDIELAGFQQINLTTIKQPLSKLGEKSIEILVNRIENPDYQHDKEKIYLGPTLIERTTVNNISLF